MGSGGEAKWRPFKSEPLSFNHKIRWLLANDKNPLMVTCSDKLGVKGYAEDKLGPGFTPKTLARATSVEALVSEIKNSSSHPDVFYVKANNDSSGVSFINGNLDKWVGSRGAKRIEHYKYEPYGKGKGEWFYAPIKYECFSEEQIGINLTDYKFHCSLGEPRFCQVIRDRGCRTTPVNEVCVNMSGTPLDFHFDSKFKLVKEFKIPDNWLRMIDIARELSKPFKYVRVDIYSSPDIYVGELTFAPRAGRYRGEGQIEAGKLLPIF
jgi:hypothetical protein